MQLSKIYVSALISLSLLSACTKKEEKAALPSQPVLNAQPANEAQAANTNAPAAKAAAPQANAAVANVETPVTQIASSENVLLSFPGEVSSQRRSTLSFRVGGIVDSIKLKAGNACKKGSVLASLDARDFVVQVEIAKANLDVAKVAARNADIELQREEELKAQNASSASAYDKLKASSDNAKANVRLADLRLTQAQQALGDTKLVAPFDCVISKQLTNVGQSITSGTGAYEVYDVSDVEVSFNVPERMAGKIKLGDKLKVRIPATGFEGELELIRVVSVVDDKTRTFQIVAKAPEGDARVVPGLYAEGVIQ